MKSQRIDVGAIRREQIVEAAVEIIAAKGLQELSLSRIEKKARMSRGQLTYYFRTKEDILLAVFDRMVELMHQRVCHLHEGLESASGTTTFQEFLDRVFRHVLGAPGSHPEFHALQYTFLAQMGYRADFRARLASLYEEWRAGLTSCVASELLSQPGPGRVSPRAVASLIQAMLHGLAVQLVADPEAFAPDEMLALCRAVLGTALNPVPAANGKRNGTEHKNGVNGKRPARARRINGIAGD
jgi:AcrR family transcriptional regulator